MTNRSKLLRGSPESAGSLSMSRHRTSLFDGLTRETTQFLLPFGTMTTTPFLTPCSRGDVLFVSVRFSDGSGAKSRPVVVVSTDGVHVSRTDALIVIGDGTAARSVAAAIAARGKPVLSAHLKPTDASVSALAARRVLAFAGIGDPDRFFRTLRAADIDVVRERAFADHHPYSPGEIEALIAEAARDGLTLVTTEKDLARLGSRANDIVPFAVTLEFDDAAGLRKFVSDRLFKAREKIFQRRPGERRDP